jgi:GGDEF domain-containing protein
MSGSSDAGGTVAAVGANEVFRAFRLLMSEPRLSCHSLVLFDVDQLGFVNAAHGRNVGDEVLRRIVVAVRGWAEPPRMSGYWAGDQVVALLPHTDESQGVHLTTRLLALLSKCGEGLPHDLHVSASAGGTTCRAGVSGAQAISLAARGVRLAKADRGSVVWV